MCTHLVAIMTKKRILEIPIREGRKDENATMPDPQPKILILFFLQIYIKILAVILLLSYKTIRQAYLFNFSTC